MSTISINNFVFRGQVENIEWPKYFPIGYPEDRNYMLFENIVSPFFYLLDRERRELHEVQINLTSFEFDKKFLDALIKAYEIYRGGQK